MTDADPNHDRATNLDAAIRSINGLNPGFERFMSQAEQSIVAPVSFPPDHFATAELLDDSEPDGAVLLKDKAGNVTAVMPRATFDAYQSAAVENERFAGQPKAPLGRGFADPDPMPPAFKNRHQRRAEAARKRSNHG
jgi:hypothetical protein